MDNFTFYSPTYFVFGRETENQTATYVKQFGGKKVLIHYGGGSVVRSGLLARVKKSLDAEKIPYVELGGAEPNPKSGLVYKGIELARKEKIDFVLGVGGGSAIDSAKAIAFGALYDGDFWDFYKGKPVTEAIPVGCVLALAGTGTEGSTDSVITHEDGMYKRCADGDCIRPKFAIMNPELTTTLPPYQTASGIADIMAHSMERLFSKTRDVEITDRLLEAVLLTMVKEGRRVIKDPSNYEARANIMWAGMIAHNNVTGVGRAQDWGTHHMENELSTTYGCSHGAGLAILFPPGWNMRLGQRMSPALSSSRPASGAAR
ncbi:MAG: iron-containing alcohol dehydrogenase [Planctomycetaceae bacterium]|nr:iron-containing alcohol dehydrogenase [Planctomycetaceae bacterium]